MQIYLATFEDKLNYKMTKMIMVISVFNKSCMFLVLFYHCFLFILGRPRYASTNSEYYTWFVSIAFFETHKTLCKGWRSLVWVCNSCVRSCTSFSLIIVEVSVYLSINIFCPKLENAWTRNFLYRKLVWCWSLMK